MYLRTFFDEQLAQYSYMIGCQRTGEAIIIDPARDITPYLETAKKEGFHLAAAAETHIHADFVSGARELAENHGAKLYLSDEGNADWKYQYVEGISHQGLKGGSSFSIGNVQFEVLHTPGHTPESISFLLTDKGGGSEVPMGIFTGDFVFVGDVGRPDLLEKAAGQQGSSEQGAKEMFESLKKFKELPDYVLVWPGHGAGSACGKSLGAVPQSSVGYEKKNNWALKIKDQEEFIEKLLSGQPEPPPYFAMMKKINKAGPDLLSQSKTPVITEKERMQQLLQNNHTTFIDARAAEEYANGHIKGFINLPYNKIFTNWAGWVLDYEKDLVVLTDQKSSVKHALQSIGFDRIAAFVEPDVISNGEDAPLEGYASIPAGELIEPAKNGEYFIIDVRNDQEWEDGHIPGAHHFPLGHLDEHLDEVPKDQKLLVHCQSGARSAIASGLLMANGFNNLINVKGGIAEWKEQNGPIQKG
ncbi:MBL fold metallo-hydrolase [Falsibacillus pallidus]|uniref:Hydroxyacylglutathione hydrolase n=1 Tax=Falsibacillus pallidus TaxID=493781 RepID=A0A370GF49_9BACI|nr:MBL fold metallo-hydrolase [Falsibacillus pallidus]RDI41034.1 hydroxyacylglutathione hydrolase [Falsibacillus pallidus]